MRRNNRKPNILKIIAILMMVLTLVCFLGAFIFMIVGLAWILIRLMIHHYVFTLLGIFVCLILWTCINCIKQIRHKPMAEEQTKYGANHKIFLTLNCILAAICVVYIIVVGITVMNPSTKTTSPQSAETQATSEYLTEPKLGIGLSQTVYVSNSGHKIHLNSDCSGMKNYVAMTYEAACEAGYEHCSRCFD